MKKLCGAIIISFLFSNVVLAGVCTVHFKRTACSGKEVESYLKCGGKMECDQVKSAESEEACQTLALAACENARVDITKSKVITAKYGGKKIMAKDGKEDFCLSYEKANSEFNQCK